MTNNVAKIVCQRLQDQGHQSIFIQENELWDISNIASDSGADIFVSIHCNAAGNEDAHGTETFYYPDAPSERLADCIQQNVCEALYTEDRGVKDGAWLAVLNSTEVEATVLVELAFISNEEEERLLRDYQPQAAAAIVDGINEYITTMEMIE